MHSTPTLILFWSATLVGIPIGGIICRLFKPAMYLFFILMILCLFFPEWSINFISREHYRSATRGIEIHPADLCAMVLLLGMWLRREEFRWSFFPPLMVLSLIFFAVGWISWLNVPQSVLPNTDLALIAEPVANFEISLYPLFELFKLARGILFFFVAYHFFQDPRAKPIFFYTFAISIVYLTIYALLNRYLWGQHRATPVYFHVNDFSTIMGIMGLYLFAFAFQKKWFVSSLMIWALTGCAFLSIILTISRSSLTGFGISAILVFALSIARFPSKKNIFLTAIALVIASVLVFKAADTLVDRFNIKEAISNIEGRGGFNESAYLMGQDHLFGVGLGNFVAWSVHEYALKTGADPYNIAHNAWYLTYAEMGLPGLIIFGLILFRFYQIALRQCFYLFRSTHPYWYACIIGAIGAITYMQCQNFFHFSFRSSTIFVLMQIILALTVRIDTDSKRQKLKVAYEH